MEDKADRREDKAEEEGPREALNSEARHDSARQENKECIDDEDEKAKGDNCEREGQDDEYGPDDRVDQSKDQGRDHCREKVPDLHPGKEIACDQNGYCCDEPVEEEVHIRILSYSTLSRTVMATIILV